LERHYTQFISQQAYTPGFALKLLSKDLNLAAEAAAASGVNLKTGRRVRALLQRATGVGFGDVDMSGMFTYQQDQDSHAREVGPIKHFAVFLPMVDPEKSVKYREEHLRFLDERRNAGMLLANGRFTDGAGGLVIYRASSREEVESWVQRDPYLVQGARRYEIHEWDIVLAMNKSSV
jgi:3-hydroxyisobutyrate dehydrogenase